MAKKRTFQPRVELEYSYDRFSGKKMIQAYGLLVPNKIWRVDKKEEVINKEEEEDEFYEECSDICPSFVGQAKRRADH